MKNKSSPASINSCWLSPKLKRVQLGMLIRIKAILTSEQQQKLRELKKQGRPGDPERRPAPPPRGEEP
jgi:hypothetical protein